ncbi:MAG: DNA polymerase I [Acidimicrobiia bacterium]|nr:DNA polymerase I [Acidimicrobiia bacterium]
MPRLALLDGHSLAFRAFYALPADLATPDGRPTNAVFGFTSMVIKLLGDEHPEAMAVAWDTPEPTFRDSAYAGYKATRKAAPDLFRQQLPLIDEVADCLGMTQFRIPGFEADDVIATLARRAAAAGWEVLVVTGDRDAFQLVGGRIKVVYTRRGISDTVMADTRWVEERYGVTPAQYPDYAALRGDTSDNLPGVPGVGEKTAARLVAEYGGLEGIYEHLEDQPPRLRESLSAARDQVFLNRRLTYLREDAPVAAAPEDLRLRPWDPAQARRVFDGLAFRSLWQRLVEVGGGGEEPGGGVLDVEVVAVSDPAGLVTGGERLALEPVWEGEVLAGVVVARVGERVAFVTAERLGGLAPALADPAVPKALHDAKPLIRALLEGGSDLAGLTGDTALAGYLVNPTEGAPDLSSLAAQVLGLEIDPEGAAATRRGAQGAFDFEAGGPDLERAGRRAVAVARLADPLHALLQERGGFDLYHGVELPLVRVLARMEQAGILVDRDYLVELGEHLRDRLAMLERQVHEAAGDPFNINSTQQLREVLFERLHLPVLKKTPKGAPSTDASVLQKMVDQHPVVGHLLAYRELEKLRSTYVDGLLPLIGRDGRIHCVFNQTGAATGRISSERPNMQNIPVRTEEGRTIRRAFVAAPGCTFVVADYSQIELRILAHLSGDAGLLEAFASGADIHTATAARVFGLAAEQVTPDLRRRAKMINFGLLYGMEAYGLGQRLEIPTEVAKEHMEAYFAQFPDVAAFMQGMVARARADGYTTTILGRRRYLPELSSDNFRIRQAAERMALNAPIQGSAADIIKKAMVSLDAALGERRLEATLLLQVHDELVVEVPLEEADEAAGLIREIMEGGAELRVPLKVDLGMGPTLADAKA